MAKLIRQRTQVEVSAVLALEESEMRALDALVGYGADPFLKVFYEKLGKAYMEPHEKGLRSLFETIRKDIPVMLSRADKAREVLNAHESEQDKKYRAVPEQPEQQPGG